MDNILVVGSSGHARVLIDVIEKEGRYLVAGLLDRTRTVGDQTLGYPVLGQEEDLDRLASEHRLSGVIVGIGDNVVRSAVTERLAECAPHMPFVTAIHPSASIGRDVFIGCGTAIMAGVVISPGCRIGRSCVLNTNSSLDHDSAMEDFSSLAPRAVTGGNCHIGHHAAIGIGAVLIQKIRVGEHTVVGAGATLLKDAGPFQLVYGSPAKEIRSRTAGEKYL